MDPSIEAVRNLVSEQDTACRSGTELMEILKPGNSKERKKLIWNLVLIESIRWFSFLLSNIPYRMFTRFRHIGISHSEGKLGTGSITE